MKSTWITVSLLSMFLVTGFAQKANATNVTFKYTVDLLDSANNFGEDFWTENGPVDRVLRGVRYYVYTADGSLLVQTGYTDASGIASIPAGTYRITVKADFKPCTPTSSNNTNLRIINSSNNTIGYTKYNVVVSGTSMNLTHSSPYTATDRSFTIGAIAAESLWRKCGGMHKTYNITYVDDTSVCGSNLPYSNNIIRIGADCWNKKTLISHEIGHRIMWHKMVDNGFSGNIPATYDLNPNTNPLCKTTDYEDYVDTSLEYADLAMKEGWANFYAAAIWNNENESDCWVRGIGLEYDCQGSSTYSQNYRDNVCFNGYSPYDYTATIIDWTRQFWDVYTNGTGVTLSGDMMDWIGEACDIAGSCNWDEEDVYSVFNSAANTMGGTLNYNWDYFRYTNGVDN